MGRHKSARPTFPAKLLSEDKSRLDALKRHHRETYGDVVHRLVLDEVGRLEGGSEPRAAGGAGVAA